MNKHDASGLPLFNSINMRWCQSW